MSSFEQTNGEPSLGEQLAALDADYQSKRAPLIARLVKSNTEALELAANDIYLENDPVAKDAISSGKDARGAQIIDLKAFLLERRQANIDHPVKGTSQIRAEELPRDVRADDPDIWKKGTGNTI